MTIQEFHDFSKLIMDYWSEKYPKLKEYKIEIDNSKRRMGRHRGSRKIISLSKSHILHSPPEDVTDTLLHEIAHAIAGGFNGHNDIWKKVCIEVGCKPERLGKNKSMEVTANWVGECPNGHASLRIKKPKKIYSCAICSPGKFNSEFIFTWYPTGNAINSQT